MSYESEPKNAAYWKRVAKEFGNELATLKSQKPIAWMHSSEPWFSDTRSALHTVPLYAAPVPALTAFRQSAWNDEK